MGVFVIVVIIIITVIIINTCCLMLSHQDNTSNENVTAITFVWFGWKECRAIMWNITVLNGRDEKDRLDYM